MAAKAADSPAVTPATEAAKTSAAVAADADLTAALATVTADLTARLATVTADVLAAARKNRINSLWEWVQAILAVGLIASVCWSALVQHDVPEALDRALFYFGRTNHARPTPTRPYGEE